MEIPFSSNMSLANYSLKPFVSVASPTSWLGTNETFARPFHKSQNYGLIVDRLGGPPCEKRMTFLYAKVIQHDTVALMT